MGLAPVAVTLLACSACVLPPYDATGTRCDAERACPGGLTWVVGRCVRVCPAAEDCGVGTGACSRSTAGSGPPGFADGPPSLARFDTKTRTLRRVPLGDNTFPSEAVVVPAAVVPEGWVLSLVYDGERDASYVAVVDGARPEDGPVARLWFDHAIPFLFHGAWAQ